MKEKISVLMVDDEEQFRATTAKLLNRRGFETTIAGTGEEALSILKQKPHDVVVLDIKMPGMDGHEALSKIQKIAPKTMVIMLTGHGTVDSAIESLEKGAFDYLNKPCDIDILTAKIKDAYNSAQKGDTREEKKARDIMIHIADYTTVDEDTTVTEAIQKLMRSFEAFISTSRVMETGHRSIIVYDTKKEIVGILSIANLIAAVRPAYLSFPKPSMADSMQYSSMFWSGLFTAQVNAMANKTVAEVMSERPPGVDENANLMEVADILHQKQCRRLLVVSGAKVVGILREQELFFEMANIVL